jgi:hypothetical protein
MHVRAVPLVGIVPMEASSFDATGVPAAVEDGFSELNRPRDPVDALAWEGRASGRKILTSLAIRYARAHAGAEIERLCA